jgi:tRNA nucleotidyltransferase (CCA-adding enzyme)
VQNLQIDQKFLPLYQLIADQGGRAFLVGGWVRDSLLGLAPKDLDVEVFGLQPNYLQHLLGYFGPVTVQGAAFPVFTLEYQGERLDVSLPRRESKVAPGHQGFEATADPYMTPLEAAARRDFTINAMMYDPLQGKLYDFFGGAQDLEAKRLSAVSERFAEDPLRVLRGMQFAARFGFDIAWDGRTPGMASALRGEYPALSQERIWGEWEKWALKGLYPSKGIEWLLSNGWIYLYPELEFLRTLRQDNEWHPEGDVLEHISQASDRAADIAEREGLGREDRLTLVFSALTHDLGKAMTTVLNPISGRITSHGHAEAGVPLAKSFLRRIGAPQWLEDRVLPLVEHHMEHVDLPRTTRTVSRLSHRIFPNTVQMYVWLVEADASGRTERRALIKGQTNWSSPAKDLLEVPLPEIQVGGNGKPDRLLKGRHLLAYMSVGPAMGRVLERAYQAQLEGEFTDEEGAVRWFNERCFVAGESN